MNQRIVHFAECAFLSVLAYYTVQRLLPAVGQHPQVIISLTAELMGVALIFLQRGGDVATDLRSVFLGFAGTGIALLIAPLGNALASDMVTTVLISGGFALSVLAKLSLRRSFGLVPANRGVKSNGMYRFVRHPMYMGYMISHIGFLLLYPHLWNVAILGLAWVLLFARTREEERVLMRDPAYQAYASKVRYRLMPGLI